MFFYRDTVIQAKTKEDLYDHSECPICHNKLAPDWKMPLRYEPMALFRMAIIGGAFASLLCLLMVKLEEIGWLGFIKELSYSEQTRIIATIVGIICLPAAFFSIWGEIKLGHWSRDDMAAYGLKCPTCGNGFLGLVGEACSDEVEGAIDVDNGDLAGVEQV